MIFLIKSKGLTNILSNLFYTKIAPKNPERPISEVMDAKIVIGNKFAIQYKAANGKKKTIEYEAEDPQTANKIVSKLQTIKFKIYLRQYHSKIPRNMEKKRKQYKAGYTYEFEST